MLEKKKIYASLLMLSLCAAPLYAQTATGESQQQIAEKQAEMDKKTLALANDAVGEVGSLKLPENRAYLLTMLGEALWAKDQKRARTVFRQAADEVITLQNAPVPTTNSFPFMSFNRGVVRTRLLQTVGKYDADFALELLKTTRSAKLQAAIDAKYAPPPTDGEKKKDVSFDARQAGWEVSGEERLENSLAVLAAKQDPKKAAAIIRRNLSKGVGFGTTGMLRDLNRKDSELGETLAKETFEKIGSLKYDSSEDGSENLMSSIQLVKEFSERKPNDKKPLPKLDEAIIKQTVAKLTDVVLQANGFMSAFSVRSIKPLAQKYAPEKMVQLNQKEAQAKKQIPGGMADIMDFDDFGGNGNSTPETMIKSSNRFPSGSRSWVYENAVAKSIERGDTLEKSRALFDALADDAEKRGILKYVDRKFGEKAVKDGKLEEARAIVNRIEDRNEKINVLTKMAMAFHAKNTEGGREAAQKMMEEAEGLLESVPTDSDDAQSIMKVAAAYAVVEPRNAFRFIEPLLDQANELIDAKAKLSKFTKGDSGFENGEMRLIAAVSGGRNAAGIESYTKELGLLAKADFGRTRALTDKMTRDELRVYAKVLLAKSLLVAETDEERKTSPSDEGDFIIMDE